MPFLTRWPRARKQVASATALALLAGIPVTIALLHDGFPVSDVDLTSRDVWVTNSEEGAAGKLNRQIEELTAGVQTASPDFDVHQDGRDVFLQDRQNATLERIDPARATLIQRTDMPADARVSLGRTTLVISGGSEVGVWITDVSNELSLDPTSVDPIAKLGEGGLTVAGRLGTVAATSPAEGTLLTWDGPTAEPVVRELELPAEHELTLVGDEPVVLDTEADRLIFADGRTEDLEGDAIHLQQPGDASEQVLVAMSDGLLQVPLAGGEATAIPADIPAQTDPELVSRPVALEGCLHGAWADAQRYLYACEDAEPQAITIEQPTVGTPLEFRVNRNVIALNNLITGEAWIINQTLRLVDNWDEITPPEETDEEEGEEKSTQQTFEDTLAERTEVNRDPIARDDEYGVRPGRTTILPVLDNDTDPDGDVLVVTNFSEMPETIGRLDYIDGGRALQFTPGTAESGVANVRYTVEDGRTGVAEANIRIQIVPETKNAAPKAVRNATITVEAGQKVDYNVLVDWFDPDGDDMFLESAVPASADDVRFTPDGFVTFTHSSSQPGEKTVAYVISDGQERSRGELTVDVQPSGSLNPIGTPDYVEMFAGDTLTFEPLKNDQSPSGRPLELTGVDEVPGDLTVEPNLEGNKITVTAVKPGPFYFEYALAAGANSSKGLVRVEVREKGGVQSGPVAVKDSAFLRAGETTTVRPLVNDVSPANLVLGVQSLDTSMTDDAVSVELINNTLIRVSSSNALTEQTQFTYTVSDGTETAVAGVTVVPVAPIVKRQPPVAVDDRRKVRAGDIASVDVLDNDFHPDRVQMTLSPELEADDDLGGGVAFVNGEQVRFQAPEEPGEYSAVYRVTDDFGESATGKVTFAVVPRDDENVPPLAETLTARTFTDSQVRIDVPLEGVDPDGDSVVLNAITSSPSLGRIAEDGPTHFVYEANPDATGTDTFEYEIEDAGGLKARGEISVGIIPRPDQRANPRAQDDRIAIRPGKVSSVEVMENDSDPNAYELRLEEELLEIDTGLVAEVEGAKVIVTAPDEEGVFAVRYRVDNGHGGKDDAFLMVTVDKDAPLIPPTADDYYVTRDEVDGSTPIPVRIRNLVNNPNGRDADLLVDVTGPGAGGATLDQENGIISVVPGETRKAVTYTVTDPEDESLTASAFIVTPPQEEPEEILPPRLRDDLERQVVDMNGEIAWDLEDIVFVPSGKDARIISPNRVQGTAGTGVAVDENSLRFTPEKDFRGQAAITFTVTDGKDEKDPNGLSDELTMQITVGDPEFRDLPPEFTTAEIQIEAGEGSEELDLRDATSHKNPAVVSQVSYGGFRGATGEIKGGLNGTTISASADFGVQPGASATFEVTLRYRDFEVPGTINVQVVASTRPLAQPVEEEIKAQRSRPISHNVLASAYNPFRDQGQPLRLVAASVENAGESAAGLDWKPDGGVTVSPGPQFIGVVSVVYTVEDATKDPNRHVQGRLLVNVRDVPDAPPAPDIVSEEDRAIVISWQTPATNGEPILDYTIRWTGGGSMTVGPNTSQQRISGLTNGTNYRFTVTARNVLGNGTASPESANGNPYGVPAAPPSASIGAPARDGSGRMTVQWGAANGNGRPVDTYTLTWNNGQTQNVAGTQTSVTVQRQVGTAHSVRVQARTVGGTSGYSPTSNAVTPVPGTPSNPTASTNGVGNNNITMTWGGATANGAGGVQYQANWGAGWQNRNSGSQYQAPFGQPTNFQVRAVVNGVTGDPVTSNTVTPENRTPSARIAKGPSRSCGSGGSGCAEVRIVVTDWQPGSYAARSWVTGDSPSAASTLNVGADGSGRVQIALRHYGIRQSNETISVSLDGNTVASISGRPDWNNLPFNSW
ncbi:Ig-like domain-containing protein [Homoserinibacter sp. YIM 151385]|uniref:Ig-like domain-containing protein n=1 Tax=Homoserinibacter sp. YIM 151385 TaxID=2985506 RepID=UPI0022F0A113|nr:Ig-like domain-containing protein [Homoserinibacter sp. YIM 151385]WBU39231.1 Ig-like domain-containing protein [Homoserinibacter sp. YIM 151385]